jgi:NodT family efflux transporter outer membrane factor (OMF) lipoprotein
MGLAGARRALGLAGACLIAGCASVGPDYTAPQIEVAERWQAALPHAGQTSTLLDWWQRFDDPVLATLLSRAETESPTLAESVARIEEARAGVTQAAADGLPVANGTARSLRNDIGPVTTVPAQTTRTVAIDAAWEIDIFGRVRRTDEAASARLEAQQNHWHEARVSLAAEVAGKYVNYRACQLLAHALERDVKSREETARITDIAANAGLTAPADAQLARAGHADTAGYLTAQQALCDITIKSLVTLTGMSEEELRKTLQGGHEVLPHPAEFSVASLPVTLLAQRPDLAASERELAAASADVGVAEASRYPRLSLLGSLSHETTRSGGTEYSDKPWSFGPSLSLPLFNGGALAARQTEAEARYEQALARYRKAVRAAVEEVETALVNLDSANRRADSAHAATTGYAAYFAAAEKNWRAGGLSLLALEEARRMASMAERNEIALQRDRVQSWIALYKAIGGGWDGLAGRENQKTSAATAVNAPNIQNAQNTTNIVGEHQ